MPVAFEVEIQGGEEAKQLLKNIDKYLPSIAANKMRKTANNVLMDLKRNMKMAFSAPRGELESRTKLKHKGFLKYDIVMPIYGIYVDQGTDPHNVSKPYLFKPWQKKTGTRSLSTAIALKGTKAHPFIQQTESRDMPIRIQQFNKEFLSELRIKMKGGI